MSVELVLQNEPGAEIFIIDESFDRKGCGDYHLSIQLGLQGISYCVIDTVRNKYLALFDAPISSANYKILNKKFNKLREENELLQLKYKSVQYSILSNPATMIPSPLYSPATERDFLEFNLTAPKNKASENFVLCRDKIRSLDAFNLYRIPNDLYNSMNAFSGIVANIHFATSLIEYALNANKNKNKSLCYLNFEKGSFSMVVIEGNKLIFYNSFEYSAKEDLGYYVLFVFEQLKLNPETLNLQMMGSIKRKSEEYDFLYKYIRNIDFVHRNVAFDYSYLFEELPGHYYFNLLNQYHCG